jgi:hypothetical protein
MEARSIADGAAYRLRSPSRSRIRAAYAGGTTVGFSLSDAFWSDFHRRFWERRGTVLSNPVGTPLVSADHVFARLVAASEHWGGAQHSFVPELFVEHAQLLTDIHRSAVGGRPFDRGMERAGDGAAAGTGVRLRRRRLPRP